MDKVGRALRRWHRPLNKKGIVFILISLLITGFLVVLFSGATRIPLDQDVDVTKSRIQSTDRIASQFPKQIIIATRSQGARAFNELSKTMMSHGYITDIDAAFETCLMNGTVQFAAGPPVICGGMENNTLPDAIETLVNLTRDAAHVNLSYALNDFVLNQTTPFSVRVEFNISIYLVDDLAIWNRTTREQAQIDMTGVLDPYYAVELGPAGEVYRFQQTGIGNWNASSLASFITAHEYRIISTGISILDRYTHTIAPSACCGIQAVIDPAVVTTAGRSYVDKKFLEGDTFDCLTANKYLYHINDPGISADFTLDAESVYEYHVGNESVSIC
jgi:hypothetical protein